MTCAFLCLSLLPFSAQAEQTARTKQAQQDFKDARDAALPLSPSNILELRRRADAIEKAGAYLPAPKGEGVREIHMTPGTAIPRLNLVGGFTTTILFYTEDGQPLNVELPGATVGNKDAYRVEVYNNVVQLNVHAQAYQASNLHVPLEGLPFPAVFVLQSVKQASEGALDQVVKVYLNTGAGKRLPDIQDNNNVSELMRLLNGLDVPGYTPLPIARTEVVALDNLALRMATRGDSFARFYKENSTGKTLIILSPGFRLARTYDMLASQTTSDGRTGYIMPPSNNSVFTVTDNSRIFYLNIDRGI